jgi:hypothetical protein
VFSGGDFKSFVCTSNAAAAEAMTKGFEQMRTTMTASGAKITTDKLTFTAGDVKDNATTVTVGGKMTATVSGNSVDTDFGPIKVPLKNEGGNWKICG